MQILFIIGNGFDLNLDMKTKYSDFCNVYQSLPSKARILTTLKNNIKKHIYSWADLEYRLGQHTSKIKTFKDFEIIFDDLVLNLGRYLKNVESEIDLTSINQNKVFEYFCQPEKCLPNKDITQIKSFQEKWNDHQWYVDIMTFNYTRTIEKLFEGNFNRPIGNHHQYTDAVSIQNIYHVHGYVDSNLILGVNDVSQLKNEAFRSDNRVINYVVKPQNNQAQRSEVDENCIAKIKAADIICIFGSSLGETDIFWWEKIGERLLAKDKCELIIYTKGEEVDPTLGHKISTIASDTKELFLNRAKLSEEQKVIVRDKIHMGVNTQMFKDIMNKKTT